MNCEEVIARLEDIAEQAEHIASVVQSITFKEFAEDVVRSAAVIRFFEIIGEAAKYIPDTVRDEFPNIAWRELAGFRDVLIHQYPKVNLHLVWKYAVEDIPIIHQSVLRIIAELQENL